MRSLLKEFREFILRGNVVDLAVGFIGQGNFGHFTPRLFLFQEPFALL